MRTSAFTVAILAITTLATNVSADFDFSALLADLSFGDTPALNSPLAVADSQDAAKELRPVPTGITMPDMVESTPGVESESTAETTPEAARAAEQQSPPRVALKDPIPQTKAESSDQVDFNTAFALQNTPSISPRTPAQTVSHHLGGCCDQECCEPTITCRPRVPVNLPSSTFLQYFRSNPCYTNLWDGYTWHCGKHHDHIHGECNCHQKRSCGWFGCSRGCKGCNDCEGCEAACGH